MGKEKRALILGATGGIGSAVGNALHHHGWRVRGLARDIEAAAINKNFEWIVGDAMKSDEVARAALGMSVIVHAVNPPNYANWDKLVLPMIDNTIAAAKAAGGARILLPGTIYNYDPASTPEISETSMQRATSRKGKIRIELERRLENASPEVPSIILRAGDFFGPGSRSSWFAQAMVTPGKPIKRIVNLAANGGHSWAYLPDLAETIACVLDNWSGLKPFHRLQFQGLYDQTGSELIEAIRRVISGNAPVRKFPWWAMKLLSPLGGFPYEAAEIAQYWKHPVKLNNRRLIKLIGAEPCTPLNVAVLQSLIHLGCIPPSDTVHRQPII